MSRISKPKRTPRKRRADDHFPLWKFSWDGLDEERDQLRALAHEINASDAEARAAMSSVSATGSICAAIRDPSTATCPLIARAAKAQRDLYELNRRLVWDYHLEFDFVRVEYATILSPTESERRLCQDNIAKARQREARRVARMNGAK